MDINRKKVTKNAFRVTKVRDKTALRVRVPGGEISGDLMAVVVNRLLILALVKCLAHHGV